ncbi:MAG TPA: polymer-forming cytoskeletal protein [Xanthobacteraceae bacterium]|jgi:cytoskeletal protein CcmA (bactofilin family)|nr:polymer-forming cytoskeletal protein [Xanthobacteraceae bacterium]
MLSNFKGKPETPPPTPAKPDVAAAAPTPRPSEPAVAPAPAPTPGAPSRPETICSIGSGTSIVGNITCDGPAQFYGHIEGEVRGSDLLIGEGAEVVGNVIAQEVTIRGRIKGTIRAVRVKLQATGAVEGDILHRSLSIEDTALFEGSSRRVENPIDTPLKAPEKPAPRPQLASAETDAA